MFFGWWMPEPLRSGTKRPLSPLRQISLAHKSRKRLAHYAGFLPPTRPNTRRLDFCSSRKRIVMCRCLFRVEVDRLVVLLPSVRVSEIWLGLLGLLDHEPQNDLEFIFRTSI